MSNTWEQLAAPFDPKDIEWRVGSTNTAKDSGMALAYITKQAAQKRLNDVVGIDKWQSIYQIEGDKVFICSISIRVNNEWITKSDGAGQTDFEGIKGGISDAFKRAATGWGIGTYLYYADTQWAPIKAQGKSYVFVDPSKLQVKIGGKVVSATTNPIDLAKEQLIKVMTTDYPSIFKNAQDIAKVLKELGMSIRTMDDVEDAKATLFEYAEQKVER